MKCIAKTDVQYFTTLEKEHYCKGMFELVHDDINV
jgi:hypothetical protein